MKTTILFLSLILIVFCNDHLNSLIEEDNLETHWQHFKEIARESIPIFREVLPGVNIEDIIKSINNDQFLIFFNGRISTGKTTCGATTIWKGEHLLPSSFSENTCVFLFIKSENSNDDLVRLTIQDGDGERELISFNVQSPDIIENSKEINRLIEEENQKCMSMKSVADVKEKFTNNLILHVPKMHIQHYAHNITIVDIGGYNKFEGTDISTEIKKQAHSKFSSNADAAILMGDVQNLVGGDTIEKDLESMFKDRKDLAKSGQLIIVFNYLERCLENDDMVPEQFKSMGCTQYLKGLAKTRIKEIADKHKDWELNIPDDNIFILALKYAKEGLALKDAGKEDVDRKIEKSNINLFFDRLEKMILSALENKIVSSTQRSIQLSSNGISVIDQQLTELNENITDFNTLKNGFDVKSTKSKYEKLLSDLNATFKNIITVTSPLKNLGERIHGENAHKTSLESDVKNIKAETSLAYINTHRELMKVLSEYDSQISQLTDYPNFKQLGTALSKLDGINFNSLPIITPSPRVFSKQIRDAGHCGRHWHKGAKKCDVQHAEYSNSAEDSLAIYSKYNAEIQRIQKMIGEYIDSSSTQVLGHYNTQINNFESQKRHLLNLKAQLENLKKEANDLYNISAIIISQIP